MLAAAKMARGILRGDAGQKLSAKRDLIRLYGSPPSLPLPALFP
jgi:hypothetical protein